MNQIEARIARAGGLAFAPSSVKWLAAFLLLATTRIAFAGGAAASNPASARIVLTGQAAYGDWRTNAPLTMRHITVADMPPPGRFTTGRRCRQVLGSTSSPVALPTRE
jgi:hypothetical protein